MSRSQTLSLGQSNRALAYRPQVDGLRFIAVFSVLFYHYSNWLRKLDLPFTIEMGTFISFFFVLSSYLITTILLKDKHRGDSLGATAYTFLVRRTLRIFPAYYFYLLLLLLLPYGGLDVREHPLPYFFYVSNFHTWASQYWDSLTAHLWTLSVEEQFYIFWLWVVLLVPSRLLPNVLYLLIVSGITFRLLFCWLQPGTANETVPMVILTPSCIDSFAWGGLLAWRHFYKKSDMIPLLKKIFPAILGVWIGLILLHQRVLLVGFDRAFMSIGSLILIDSAVKGSTSRFGVFLQHKWITWLGKISYGIYLYHLLLPYVFWKVYNQLAASLQQKHGWSLEPLTIVLVNPVVSLLLYCTLTILFAAASWYFLEQPFNRLKRYFRYAVVAR